MIKKRYSLNYFLILIIGLTQFYCFDKPDEFVAPVWDAEVNIPITSKQFELLEIVEKDSSLLKASDDAANLGLIYFGDNQAISAFSLEDDLKLDGFETGFNQKLGQINVDVPIPAASEIRVEDWTTEVTSGSYQVFPEQEGNVTIDISGIETVESILADEGDLSLFIVNRLPVEIVLRGIVIRNQDDGSIVAERPSSDPSQWIPIAPLSVDTIMFSIDGLRISNSLQYEGTIWSGGSGDQEVQVPEEAGTTILALFENLVIGAATAQLPIQNFDYSGSVLLSDSTRIEEAVIEDGSGEIIIDNNIDLNIALNVVFQNLFDTNDRQYELSVYLNKNEKDRRISLPSLSGWRITSIEPGTTTNELSYSISAVTDSTGEVSTITKNDSVIFDIQFDDLELSSFEGKLKPTTASLEESSFKLDYGDLNENLNFAELNFKDAAFVLNLQSSADVNIEINGEILGNNGLITVTEPIENIIIPSEEPVKVDISELINGFTQVLPDSFSLKGAALLNPYYQIVSVANGDSIFGDIEFEIPLNVGISAGSFKDTFEVDLGDIDADDINRLNYGEVTFEIINSVPVGLIVKSAILDSNFNKVLDIPTPNNSQEYIEVPKPEVSENGEILGSESITQTLVVLGDDIQKLINNPYMMLDVSFSTSGENNLPVKFKTTNKISFDVRVKAEYRVDL